MAKDKRKIAVNRQKKLAKQKAKAKARHLHQQQQGVPFEDRFGISRQALQQSPLVGAWSATSIFENGIGTVVVARQVGADEIAAGIFLVDTWCLGVKNAFFRIFSTLEFDDLLADVRESQDLEKASPEYAAKLISESIAYAKRLGFAPHADYGDAAVVLGGIDGSRCTDTFVFGQEGKPLYASGPHDTLAKSNSIIARLDAVCGKGNYNFLLGVPGPGDDSGAFFTDDELDAGGDSGDAPDEALEADGNTGNAQDGELDAGDTQPTTSLKRLGTGLRKLFGSPG